MCLNPNEITLKPDSNRSYVLHRLFPMEGFDRPLKIPVPCGKCVECLEHRQNDIMARVYNEAKQHKRMHFLTLTYREENLPIGHSIWRCNRETGEFERFCSVDVISGELQDVFRDLLLLRCKDAVKRNKPRVLDIPIESFNCLSETHDYFDRYTPTVNAHDFQTVFKQWRINMKRKFRGLPAFKYCVVGEYGTQKTCRPHLHCVFISDDLEDWQVRYLGKLWYNRFGNFDLRCPLSRIDSDGKDNYSCIAKYIGKYVVKGAFDLQSVKDGLTVKMRFCCSKNFGKFLPQKTVDTYLCKDMYKYNLWTVQDDLCPADLDRLIRNIAKRSFYKITYKVKDGESKYLTVPLPMSLKMFVYEAKIDFEGKVRWPPLYYMVSRFLRNKSLACDTEELEQFINAHPSQPRSKVVVEFQEYKDSIRETSREVRLARVKKFYASHSKVF